MSWFDRVLRTFHLLPDRDRGIDKSIDTAYRDHAEALQAISRAADLQREGNSRFRESVELAKRKSNSVFAEFELSIRDPASRQDRFPNADA